MRAARAWGDLVAGLLTAGFGATVVLHVRGFPELPGGQPGPALFPGIVGGLMVVFGLALAGRALAGTRRAEPAEGTESAESAPPAEPPIRRRAAVLNALAVLGAVLAYVVLDDILGFVPTVALLLALLMWRLGTRPPVAVGAAVVTALLLYALFRSFLFVPLPQGPLG